MAGAETGGRDDERGGAPEAPEHYEIIRCIGRGGCGTVYLARDTQLERDVALKFLTDARPSDIERFRREARFAARLDDPAIVRVYELRTTASGPCIAMQYVAGGDLAQAGLAWEEVVRAVVTVARALGHAHTRGVVHRDVKPENILRDAEGRVYLTDFGIARDVRPDRDASLSADGQVIGTPALMPPEQARGRLHALDGRSDVYALGATLYQLLADRPPFEGEHVIDVLHAVLHEAPPLLRFVAPGVPRELEPVVMRCLEKRREDRYQRMEDLASDLELVLSGQEARGGVSMWFRRLVASRQRQRSTSELHAEDWRAYAESARRLAAWDSELFRISRDVRRTFPELDAICENAERVLADRPDAAWARFHRGMVLRRRGCLDEAVDEMERSVDRAPEQAAAQFELGSALLQRSLALQRAARQHISRVGSEGPLAESRSDLDRAVAAFEEAHRLRGDLPAWQLDYARAVARLAGGDFDSCVEICDGILAVDPDVAEVWKLRGDAQARAGRDPSESYDEAVAVRRSYHEALVAHAEDRLRRGDTAACGRLLDRALRVDPALAEARTLRARAHLSVARNDRSTTQVVAGLNEIRQSLELDPDQYEATVTRAELQMLSAELSRDASWIDRALDSLSDAALLPGCRNRVLLAEARARLVRADLLREAGRDARSDYAWVLACRSHPGAQTPDNAPWTSVIAAAEAGLLSLER